MAANQCTWSDMGCHLDWFWDEVRLVFVWSAEQVLGALAWVLGFIPVPDWAFSVGSVGAGIPASVWWFASVARLDFGASVIASAYVLRFIIRRLPVVG